ncbi:hypothetical protein F5B20DRAFT_582953 [Whalleya microplaca]|nr:hypothetical protein F5B20DRAFT_582953 [Whalleya microplaca]
MASGTTANNLYTIVPPVYVDSILAKHRSITHSKNTLLQCGYYLPDAPLSQYYNPWKLEASAFRATPAPCRRLPRPKRRAVVIDCEVLPIGDGKAELVKLCAVDFFTGEVLIDALVDPLAEVQDWHTDSTGVSFEIMEAAIEDGSALSGWAHARAELFKFVDTHTVLVGWTAYCDLFALRTSHSRIVDSFILTQEAMHRAHGAFITELNMWMVYLAICGPDRDSDERECLVDTLATRELVIQSLRKPQGLDFFAQQSSYRRIF